MESDGGPDHNTTYVWSKLAITALWLVTGKDRIAAVRCCAGWSALNVAEKGMGLLNMGWSNSAFSFPDPSKLPQWFWEILKPTNSMAEVRKEINTYDREFDLVVNLKRRKMKEKNEKRTYNMLQNEKDEINDVEQEVVYEVGKI